MDHQPTSFLVYRDGGGRQRLHALPVRGPVRIGRRADCDLTLDWDPLVSRVHAELERIGGAWLIADAGPSRNGTFLNGERVEGDGAFATATSYGLGAPFSCFARSTRRQTRWADVRAPLRRDLARKPHRAPSR